ncbi:MAG TPA: S8 family serine peptidase [Bryobacteraceae bacterium]|nr:S8 family serine peptidase [Bryobacteraceae bacterium]
MFFLKRNAILIIASAVAPAIFAQSAASQSAAGQSPTSRYALILEDPPVTARFATREAAESTDGRNYRQQIEARQRSLRDVLASRHIAVTGSVTILTNAIFVAAPKERVAELNSLPGVKGVVPLRRHHLDLNRANVLLNAPAAWNSLGGSQNAGAGMKIAIIDTGIDQTHPAFQDSSLAMPAGYPICNVSNCASYTNNKVIVARSYVQQLAAGSDPNNPAADSRPDDYSPRDRSGHGTATASCAAAASNTGPAGLTFNGMAPKAYLGNYKIFGSPTVNDGATDDVILMALEDALNDHMDIASLSLGSPAFTGPLDTGAACGNATGVPCDLLPPAVESAVQAGMVVVMAAGNEGDTGFLTPTLSTISSPGDAPSGIAVGATTNSHFLTEGVEVPGSGVPSNLQKLAGTFGNGNIPIGAVAAPLVDVTALGDNGLACSGLPAGSLTGAFVLIERGTCDFSVKAANAQNAGASGVIFYMADQTALVSPDVGTASLTAIMISNNDGVALKSFIDSNPGQTVYIDGAAFEQTSTAFDQLTSFSSLGPSTGLNALKPDLVAVGQDIYMAAENYDPLGAVYSANRYSAAAGTSFSTPLVSGAAALVKQAHPSFTPAQIKSVLVNTGSQVVTSDDSGDTVSIPAVGGGKLDAGTALQTTITANPASISFGVVTSLPTSQSIQITNPGTSPVNLSLAVAPISSATGASLALNKQTLTLAAGASSSVSLTISGTAPKPGSYYGAITVQGAGPALRIPYLFLAGSGVANNLIPLSGDGFDGTVGQQIPDGVIAIKLIDSAGVPVAGVPVSFTANSGGAIQTADSQTNAYGIAQAVPILGAQPGSYDFNASVTGSTSGGLSWDFTGSARTVPTIAANGILNGASFEMGRAVAPGSYVSIFGSNLSDFTDFAKTIVLPLAIDYAMVSFDAANISVPGHLIYVSPGQVNLQVPWELQGQGSAQVKVTIDFSYGNVVTLHLSNYSPAFFEIGGGNVAALDSGNQVIGTGNPAKQGQTVQLYLNGLGPVNNQPASGDPAPSSPLATCMSAPTVTIGGKTATSSFCGLAPGFPGLYQINATVPTGLTPGSQPITVSIGGQTSQAAASLVVQ